MFVHSTLTMRILAMEAALGEATQAVAVYQAGQTDLTVLARALLEEARALSWATLAVDSVPPPPLAGQEARALWGLQEDLALFGDQCTRLLQETSVAALQDSWGNPRFASGHGFRSSDPPQDLAYGARMRSALAILRRAEDWLETLDQDTGAHATLPGFAPGAPALETQLGLP
jgi:hypothetical protein